MRVCMLIDMSSAEYTTLKVGILGNSGFSD